MSALARDVTKQILTDVHWQKKSTTEGDFGQEGNWRRGLDAPPASALWRCAMLDRALLRRSIRGLPMALALAGVIGCEAFPQLRSLERTASEPRREKVRQHAACLAESKQQNELISCMHARGYRFIGLATDPRAQSCHTMRGDPDQFPEAYCFELDR
jgi:hypothetical protein